MARSGYSFVPDRDVHALVTDQYALLAAGLLPSAFGLLTPKTAEVSSIKRCFGQGSQALTGIARRPGPPFSQSILPLIFCNRSFDYGLSDCVPSSTP